jgi:DNA-binding response OmpR family regulator
MAAPKNGKRVLAIDDDPLARDIYRQILEEAGFEVDGAPDGKAGIEKFKAGRYHCVLLDIFMPGLSGLDVIEALDPEKSGVPVIAISGGGGQTGARPLALAASLGAAASLGKDFEHGALVDTVKRLTGVK